MRSSVGAQRLILDEASSADRQVVVEAYSGRFSRLSIRVSLRSGPRGAWSSVGLTKEEMDAVVIAYLRYDATFQR